MTAVPPDPTTTAPPRRGRSLTPEDLAKMAEGRRAANERKRAEHEARMARRSGAPRAPDRGAAGGLVPVKLRREMEKAVGYLLWGGEAGVFIGMHAAGEHRFDDDKLDKWERELLAEALVAEGVKYPAIRRALGVMVEIVERSGIPLAVAVIVAPRMVRHGLLPELAELVTQMRDEVRKMRKALPEAAGPEAPPSGDGLPPVSSIGATEPVG